MDRLRLFAFAGFLTAGALASCGSSAQEVFVRDLKCRATAIAACVADNKAKSCTRNQPPAFGQCNGPYRDTPDEVRAVECASRIDNLQAGTCLVPVNLQTLINSSGILAELKETNAILRSDMRTMLNQLCRSTSSQPDKCDEVLPPKTEPAPDFRRNVR